MYRKLPGFSLIEMLVIIMIAAILLSLGMGSLVALRNRLTVRNASSELVQNLISVRNQARNGVFIDKVEGNDQANIQSIENRDYFAVRFSNSTYFRGQCSEEVNITCEYSQQGMKSQTYSVVEIQPESDDCNVIIMYLASGRFQFASESGGTVIPNDREECRYSLVHGQIRLIKSGIKVNRVTGKISLD